MKTINLKIAVDGYDGTGKTSIINYLVDHYSEVYSCSVERLIPSSVALFKSFAGNTRDYMNMMSNEFRISSYLWESYFRLLWDKERYENPSIVLFDRWIFTYMTCEYDFAENRDIVSHLISTIPKPDLLILLEMTDDNIISNLRKKDDWMLSYYDEDEIKKLIYRFYDNYEKFLNVYNIPYVRINANGCLNSVEEKVKCEIDRLIKAAGEVGKVC